MKKNPIYLLLTCAAAITLTFTACQKTSTTDPNADLAVQSDDQSQFTAETDAIADDANIALESVVSFSARNNVNLICDATITVDSNATTKSVTITYNGGTCVGAGRTRTGVVVVSMPSSVRWRDAGTVVTINYQNIKVTRNRDNKSLTLNGSLMIENQTGGKLSALSATDSIVHNISSDGLSVKFNDGTQHSWNIAKKRDFRYNNGIVITTTGNHDQGIAEWGTNRLGNTFATRIAEPLIVRQDCSFRLTSGKVEYSAAVNLTITFGLNALGQPTSCPSGSYYFKVEWPDARTSNMHTIIWPY